ncbi:MAG: nitroreductase family protein [Chthonomonas sp.]|nr:nitroreductase family protein [Chthonomonas sp.]
MSFAEPLSTIWKLRYGAEAPESVHGLESFMRHRSVRKFSDQAVPESMIQALVAAAQSASTSSNLQLWSIVSVQEPERRQAVAQLCANQKQVLTAPWFLCFLADHHRLKHAAAAMGEPCDGIDYMEFLLMACIDAGLASERLACAAEAAGLGVCYIGALRNHPGQVAELLELPDGVFGVFGMAIGFPSAEASPQIKPRLDQGAVWFREKYDAEPDIAPYDARMTEFYAAQAMSTDETWSKKSGKRADGYHMSGRDILKDWLAERGMGRR